MSLSLRLVTSCFLVLLTFAACHKDKEEGLTAAHKRIVLMLDAAHGGADAGAVSETGDVVEKEQVLKMCRLMIVMAQSYNIEARLVRWADTTLSGDERLNIINAGTADLLLSVHIRKLSPPNEQADDYEAIVSPSSLHYADSRSAALAILQRFSSSGRDTVLTQRDVNLQMQAGCPSVVLECGNVDNPANKELIKDDRQMEKLCREILEGVARYANTR